MAAASSGGSAAISRPTISFRIFTCTARECGRSPPRSVGTGNAIFDGRNEDEDFGMEQVTEKDADRDRFRTPPCAM